VIRRSILKLSLAPLVCLTQMRNWKTSRLVAWVAIFLTLLICAFLPEVTALGWRLFHGNSAKFLGYLTSLLLRALPAQYNDPCPQAGTPMSAAQMAERAKPKSPAPPVLEAASPPSTNKTALTDKPVSASPNHNRNPARTRKPTPRQKTLSGKSTHQYAHHRIASSMGLDHRSINIAFAPATQLPGRMNASDAALTARSLRVIFSIPHDTND
jgi:hypothetical protein